MTGSIDRWRNGAATPTIQCLHLRRVRHSHVPRCPVDNRNRVRRYGCQAGLGTVTPRILRRSPHLLRPVFPSPDCWSTEEKRAMIEPAMTAKQQVQDLLSRLPDDCSLEDIQYHLYVIQKVQEGLDSLDRGEGIPHEEVKREMARWFAE